MDLDILSKTGSGIAVLKQASTGATSCMMLSHRMCFYLHQNVVMLLVFLCVQGVYHDAAVLTFQGDRDPWTAAPTTASCGLAP